MSEINISDLKVVTEKLGQQASRDELRLTVHAHQEMAEENISYDSVCEAMMNSTVIENYPEYQRGPCCLLCGQTESGRYLHIVCTTSLEVAVIITVYEPVPPKWITPFQRRKKI